MNALVIDAGGGGGPSDWSSDFGFSMPSKVGIVSNAIDTSRVANPAPQAVYRSQRYASHLVYVLSNLTPQTSYNLRLHFVESYWTAPKKRVFNIKINTVTVLTNFDVFQSAGGSNIAIVEQFAFGADVNGKITLEFDASVNNASIAGIECYVAIASPTPAPQPTTFYTPTATAAPKLTLIPNPFTQKVCLGDPCSPKVDTNSSVYNTNWFGTSAIFPHITPAIPGNPNNIGYESIAIYSATNSDPSYNIFCANGGSQCGANPLLVNIPNGANADQQRVIICPAV